MMFWDVAARAGTASEEEVLEALSLQTGTPIARSLVVSAEARNSVPERFVRRFGILPLAISDAALDIATANPLDLDCEKTLGFATGRRIRMLLAPPHRITERIEEVYAPFDRVSKLVDKASAESHMPITEKPEAT